MEALYIKLKILLPFRVFDEIVDVKQVVAETSDGSYGFLPNRLDCVASIVPGILMYESKSKGTVYLAVDEGIMVKAGKDIYVSVRNAVGGTDLGKLHQSVEQQFLNLDEREKNIRATLAKLESSFIRQLTQFTKTNE